MDEAPALFFSRETINNAYRKELRVNQEAFNQHLDELIEFLGCSRNVAKPGMREKVQTIFGPTEAASSVSDVKLRALFSYPLAFDALYRGCMNPTSKYDPTWKPSAGKRATRSRKAAAGPAQVTRENQFPDLKGMRNSLFRTTLANKSAPFALNPAGSEEIDLYVLAKETFSFVVGACSQQFFTRVDPMCCTLALKPGFGRSHILASNNDLIRSNKVLQYADPAHPNTYFVQLFGCYPAFLVMTGNTVRFFLPPDTEVQQLRDERGRVNVDKSDYSPDTFANFTELSSSQGTGIDGLKELVSCVAAHVAVALCRMNGDISNTTVLRGPNIKEYWFGIFLATFQKVFAQLHTEVEMIAKEAFQVTAAFLSLPSETPVLPEVFKRAILDNLKALSSSVFPQPMTEIPQPSISPPPWHVEVHAEHIEWSDEEVLPAFEQ